MPTARVTSGPIQTQRLPDGRRELLAPVVVDLGVLVTRLHKLGLGRAVFLTEHHTTALKVPKGFDTDFSSIPPALAWALGDWRDYDVAGIVHDWLYRVQAPRRLADRVWRWVARSGEPRVNPVRGLLGWLGLRVGGWVAYRRHGKD